MKNWHKISAVFAVILIIIGFGMTHSVKGIAEIISLLMIGLGSLYLLILFLIKSRKNR